MEDFIGTYGNRLIIAVVGVGAALLLLAIVLWFIRRRSGSAPFIRGGRNRQPRLQVLDATAVDARRRLVLVRRDNVEHLVMIGGPTDIVIESGIGAIPFMKDVRDPQEDALIARDADRQRTLAQAPQEDVRPAAAFTAPELRTEAPEEPRKPTATTAPVKPAPVASPSPAPAVASRPIPAAPPVPPQPAVRKPQPTPATPPVSTVAPSASAPSREAPEAVIPPAPRTLAREPVAPSIPVVPPLVAAAIMQQDEDMNRSAAPASQYAVASEAPVAPQSPLPSQAPSVSPVVAPVVSTTYDRRFAEPQPTAEPTLEERSDPVGQSEAAIAERNAVDFLDAARDRVLPAYSATPSVTTASATPVAPLVAKPEPLAPSDNGPVFGDQLTSDFESLLEAEIAKSANATTDLPRPLAVAPSVNLDTTTPDPQPDPKFSEAPADAERDVQKEMARIFGEMSVTRDR
ncbi:flagellar biosynthetic protein FliO [Agrobacterium cavarae]